MKLQQHPPSTSFYESFSDLIFATMAIFVLLTIIFLVLAEQSPEVKEARERLRQVTDQVDEVQQQRKQVAQRTKRSKAELAVLKSRNAEVAIAVDMTGSMEQELQQLTETVNLVSQILPRISPQVRIGVVGFRSGERGDNQNRVFPIERIKGDTIDGGASLRKLQQFMDSMEAVPGIAPVDEATRQALKMFTPHANYNGNQIFMLLGDVGPYEFPNQEVDRMTPQGRARAETMVRDISRWKQKSNDRSLIILFSGRDEIQHTRSSQARIHKHSESQLLFKRFASASGEPKAYTENVGNMLAFFLTAIVQQ